MYLRTDSSKCSGCRACLLACALHHFGENNPKKARLAITPHFPNPGTFEVRTCTQCGECAEVCPVDCILQNENGVYYIDAQECTACMACVDACPEGVMFVHPDYKVPFKCEAAGECVTYCATKALYIE